MITFEMATKKILDQLVRYSKESGIEMSIEDVHEYDSFWVFFYNSKKYLESDEKDLCYLIAGNAPILVTKESGELINLKTSGPFEDQIKFYSAKLKIGDA